MSIDVLDLYDGYLDYFDEYFEYEELGFYREDEWVELSEDENDSFEIIDKVIISYQCESKNQNLLKYLKKMLTKFRWDSKIEKYHLLPVTCDGPFNINECCSICNINMNSYKHLRDFILPECGHVFHVECSIECDIQYCSVCGKKVSYEKYSLEMQKCFTTNQLEKLRNSMMVDNRTFACDFENKLKNAKKMMEAKQHITRNKV